MTPPPSTFNRKLYLSYYFKHFLGDAEGTQLINETIEKVVFPILKKAFQINAHSLQNGTAVFQIAEDVKQKAKSALYPIYEELLDEMTDSHLLEIVKKVQNGTFATALIDAAQDPVEAHLVRRFNSLCILAKARFQLTISQFTQDELIRQYSR